VANRIITVGIPAGFNPPSLKSVKPKSKYSFLAAFPSETDSSNVCTNMLSWGAVH